MDRNAAVYNYEPAGYLIQTDKKFIFQYDEIFFSDSGKPAIGLTLPKSQREYRSKYLFPFFFGLLSEGDMKIIQCRKLGIDENNHFTRL
ncbi:MAG: phosphatidylinositol kinase [Ignavibacteria bacterium]|nr:phosphatidylinositol kinase [Ignavibacteria bacterium]